MTEWETQAALRDGSTVHIRSVRRSDVPALEEFLESLSSTSLFLRFFTAAANLSAAAAAAADVDDAGRYGLVADSGGKIVAHAEFVTYAPWVAEVAFEVADAWQGRGVGTILLGHLVQAASERGIERLTAVVRAENHRMIEVFRESGLSLEVTSEPGELHLTMPATLDREAQRRFADRDRIAAIAGVRNVLAPASIAIVGASSRRGSVGGTIVDNLLEMGYPGELSLVHPRHRRLRGRPVRSSLLKLDHAPELVVIAVPAQSVPGVARDAAAIGARALVVVSSGFAEAGPAGAKLEAELVGICRSSGMRLVGPNCLGVINASEGAALDASFAPTLPAAGNVALLSQSGALGIAAIEAAAGEGLGLSAFASVGNKADLSGNDFLQYWEQDPGTDVALLYLESFGNPRKFGAVARRVSRHKPVVIVKAGRSTAGARAARSHTGALLQASDTVVDALCQASGVVRVEGLSELFDVGRLLAAQPPPKGSRVAIISNGGGLGILCADACEAAGLHVVELSARLQRRLRRMLPPAAAVGNPVDLLAEAGPDTFAAVANTVARSGEADAVLVLGVRTAVLQPAAVGEALERLAAGDGALPTLGAVLIPRPEPVAGARVPVFAFPENAASALGRAARYGEWRATPHEPPYEASVEALDAGAAVIAEALARGPGWLTPAECDALLDAHGIARIEQTVVPSSAAAGRAAARFGGDVAIKAVVSGLLHKSDVGAVELGLRGGGQVTRRATAMRRRLSARGHHVEGFLVQRMAPEGVEILVGAVQEASFGPLVLCALGGTTAELLHDTSTRLAPISRREASEMLRQLRSFPLLTGYRGGPAGDITALEDLLVRTAAMVTAHPHIAELDLNPVLASAEGAMALDARVRVQAEA